ncbi:MAG TPA: DMT family transporter [Actinomycetes bacterium]|nr:DMT family transporter [Actinomycetes bacterium]
MTDTQTRQPDRTRTPTSERLTTYALLFGGMALFGSATPVSKLVGEDFPSMLASGLRMLTAAAVLVPFLVRQQGRRWWPQADRADWARLVGIAAIGTVGFTLLLFFGLQKVPGAVGAVIMATTPAVTALGAVLFLRDRLDRWTGLGLAMAVAGVVAVNLGEDTGSGADLTTAALWVGSLLVLGAVCSEAAYTLLGKRLTADLSPVQIASVAAVLSLLIFLPWAIVQAVGFDWSGPAWTDWVAMVWWGAGTMGLGSVLWFRGMMRVAATTASGFMAVMPVSALLLSYVLLGEDFAWVHLAGMAGVLAGLAAIVYRDAHTEE